MWSGKLWGFQQSYGISKVHKGARSPEPKSDYSRSLLQIERGQRFEIFWTQRSQLHWGSNSNKFLLHKRKFYSTNKYWSWMFTILRKKFKVSRNKNMKKRFNFFFRDVMKPWLTKLLKINMWSSVFPWVFWHCKFWASFFHFVCAKLLAKTEIIIINTDIGTMQLVLIPMLLRDVPLQEINNNLNNKKVNNRHFYKIYSEYLRRIK